MSMAASAAQHKQVCKIATDSRVTVPSEKPLLQPGVTCWKTAQAHRVALLVDGSEFMTAIQEAIERARDSVLLIGWDFDPHVALRPECSRASEPLSEVLERIVRTRPGLALQFLIWDMAAIYAAQRRDSPRSAGSLLPKQVDYRLDGLHPLGASHHQKIWVVDGAMAFCGGADLTRNRWDTSAHLAVDPRRRTLDGLAYPPRHEVVMAVDSEAARALDEVARERWRRATGTSLPAPSEDADPWPAGLEPDAHDLTVGVSRTHPAWRGEPEIREIETLYLRSIGAAQRLIYIETQYFSSPLIAEALARRLVEQDGPDILLLCPLHSGGRGDRLTMDTARDRLVQFLNRADRHGRFRACVPYASSAEAIIVHSKLMIIDDRMVTVGSANLNNRSLGFDTECALAIATDREDERGRRHLAGMLARLLGGHLGCGGAAFDEELRQRKRLFSVVDQFNGKHRRHLRPLVPTPASALQRLIATFHIGDPNSASDNFRPWRRRRILRPEDLCASPAALPQGDVADAPLSQ
jgi:phosphatidylserine/phosphatidylglycerophosphate/cardiolipin synthase-like enzyme